MGYLAQIYHCFPIFIKCDISKHIGKICVFITLEVDTGYQFKLISFTNFNAQFLYSLTICMLHYNPRHVSNINMPIFRRTNCIITASGILTVCTVQYSMLDESRLQSKPYSCTVQPFTESDVTRCCDNTICPPEDGHVDARNMSRRF